MKYFFFRLGLTDVNSSKLNEQCTASEKKRPKLNANRIRQQMGSGSDKSLSTVVLFSCVQKCAIFSDDVMTYVYAIIFDCDGWRRVMEQAAGLHFSPSSVCISRSGANPWELVSIVDALAMLSVNCLIPSHLFVYLNFDWLQNLVWIEIVDRDCYEIIVASALCWLYCFVNLTMSVLLRCSFMMGKFWHRKKRVTSVTLRCSQVMLHLMRRCHIHASLVQNSSILIP